MAINNRIFYACQAVCICKIGHVPSDGAGANVAFIKGVQSVGITTNFTLDQAFELGQVEIYENAEEVADLEVTLEKLIDGEKLLYLSAAGEDAKSDITAAANARSNIFLGIYDDAVGAVSDTAPREVVFCSGMYVSSVSYAWTSDGFATESLTLVGNDKFWGQAGGSSGTGGVVADPTTLWPTATDTGIDGSDVPVSGLVRRNCIVLAESTIPAEATSQGSASSRHISSVNISADFGRDQILELGRFGPYYRYAAFPFEVTAEFEVTASNSDRVAISGNGPNLIDRTIIIVDDAGTKVDLGAKCKLSSVSYSGGDTGGGNVTCTYSYSTFNKLNVDGGGTYWATS